MALIVAILVLWYIIHKRNEKRKEIKRRFAKRKKIVTISGFETYNYAVLDGIKQKTIIDCRKGCPVCGCKDILNAYHDRVQCACCGKIYT